MLEFALNNVWREGLEPFGPWVTIATLALKENTIQLEYVFFGSGLARVLEHMMSY